jgi:hypothetical protein
MIAFMLVPGLASGDLSGDGEASGSGTARVGAGRVLPPGSGAVSKYEPTELETSSETLSAGDSHFTPAKSGRLPRSLTLCVELMTKVDDQS